MMKCTDPSIVLSYLGYPFPTMHSAVTCSCSKSFGETTHNTEPCKAHRSPNAAKSASLVKVPPLEGLARHIAHQTILNNAIRTLCGTLRFS